MLGAAYNGQAYCPGPVELLGSIVGSLYCNEFLLSTNNSRYNNHLLNNIVDFNSLSPYFAGVDLFGSKSHKSIIKCSKLNKRIRGSTLIEVLSLNDNTGNGDSIFIFHDWQRNRSH